MKRMLALVFALLVSPTFAADAPAAGGRMLVKLQTSDGDIFLALNPDKAPKSVANFLAYVKAGQYDGTIFHRVKPGFMAQGGGFTSDFKEKETREPIENESRNGLSNTRGTIAMARTNDPHSATAQWYINLVDNGYLDGTDYKWGYAVFGEVVRGMQVVDSIAEIPTGPAGPFQGDVPFRPVVIEKAEVVEALPSETNDQAAK